MRCVLVLFVCVAWSATASARPRVAIIPIDGDATNGQLTDVVSTEAAKDATVTDAAQVEKAMHALAIDAPSAADLKKLRKKLEVDAIVSGAVAKDGKRLRLTLTVTGKTGKGDAFEIHFTKSSAKAFRAELAEALQTHIAEATAKGGDDEDEARPKKKPERVAVKDRDEDDAASRKKIRKKHRPVDDDTPLEAAHHQITQAGMWLDGGAAGLRRTLSYDHTGTGTPPPPVGTAGATAQLEGEYYPGASDRGGAGFGITGTIRQTVGLAITLPGTALKAPITEALYTVGARYRVVFGESSLAFGADYWRYRYLADRSKLTSPGALDMPDVDYSAIAPAATAKLALSPAAGAFVSLEIPIVLSTGPVATSMGGGPGLAFALDAGIDVALATHYGLRFEAIFDQVGVKFDQTNMTAMTRGVTGATDRTVGLVATFAMIY